MPTESFSTLFKAFKGKMKISGPEDRLSLGLLRLQQQMLKLHQRASLCGWYQLPLYRKRNSQENQFNL